MSLANRLLPFIGKTIIFFVLIGILWHFIAPAYNHLLAAVSDAISPSDIATDSDGRMINVTSQTVSAGIHGQDLHYGLLLVIALIAATPGLRLIQRLKFIPIAVVVMFVIHVIGILIFAWSAPGDNPLLVLFSVLGSALFPIVIWVVLSFRYFMPKLQEASLARTSLRPKGKKRWELRR